MVLHSPPATRRGQALAYLIFVLAGAAAALLSPAHLSAVNVVWVAFLLAGGILAAVGRLLDRWPGEFVGLPLIGACTAIYGTAVLCTPGQFGPIPATASGLAMLAVGVVLFARWREVNQIRAEALAQAQLDRTLAQRRHPAGRGL